jgi:hypothetical protein
MASREEEIVTLDDYPNKNEPTSNSKRSLRARQDDIDLARFGKKPQLRVSHFKNVPVKCLILIHFSETSNFYLWLG